MLKYFLILLLAFMLMGCFEKNYPGQNAGLSSPNFDNSNIIQCSDENYYFVNILPNTKRSNVYKFNPNNKEIIKAMSFDHNSESHRQYKTLYCSKDFNETGLIFLSTKSNVDGDSLLYKIDVKNKVVDVTLKNHQYFFINHTESVTISHNTLIYENNETTTEYSVLPNNEDIKTYFNLTDIVNIKFFPYINNYSWDKKSMVAFLEDKQKYYYLLLTYENEIWGFGNILETSYDNTMYFEEEYLYIINNPILSIDVEHYKLFEKNFVGTLSSFPKMGTVSILTVKDQMLLKETVLQYLSSSKEHYQELMQKLLHTAKSLDNGIFNATPQFLTNGDVIFLMTNYKTNKMLFEYYKKNELEADIAREIVLE